MCSTVYTRDNTATAPTEPRTEDVIKDLSSNAVKVTKVKLM